MSAPFGLLSAKPGRQILEVRTDHEAKNIGQRNVAVIVALKVAMGTDTMSFRCAGLALGTAPLATGSAIYTGKYWLLTQQIAHFLFEDDDGGHLEASN